MIRERRLGIIEIHADWLYNAPETLWEACKELDLFPQAWDTNWATGYADMYFWSPNVEEVPMGAITPHYRLLSSASEGWKLEKTGGC